jgi:flagellum-specific ATP synthase
LALWRGSGVGKSSLLAMMTKHTTADIVVVVLVGERGREASEFIEETLGEAGLENSVVVLATSEASPVLRRKANDTGHTIAEYFRDRGSQRPSSC